MRRLALSVLAVALCLPAMAREGYEIGPGDIVHVVVLGQDGMTGDFPVDAEGMMYFPFLGRIKASGMAPAELERKLTTLLADGYLKRPQCSVLVKEFRSRKVFVTGEVQRPGAYGLRANGSLLMLLVDVGGVTAEAGHEVIVIRPPDEPPAGAGTDDQAEEVAEEGSSGDESPIRSEETLKGEDLDAKQKRDEQQEPEPEKIKLQLLPGEVPGSEIVRVSLRELQSGNPEKDLELQEGDTVYVPKAAQIYVTGHVVRPGAYRFEEGTTVYQALTMAGGPTDRGSSKVRIMRLVDGKRKEIKVRMTDILLPEDTVKVPERFF